MARLSHLFLISSGKHLSLQLIQLVLTNDFLRLRKNHTGVYLEKELRSCLEEFGIKEHILAIAGDNASNNDKLIDMFASNVISHPGRANRVRCFGHILNLAMQVRF